MPKNGESETFIPLDDPQSSKSSRDPSKGGGAGPRKQPRKSSQSVCCLNPFSCCAGSRIQVQDEAPRSIADTFAAAAASGLLPEPQELENSDRIKISADPEKCKATKELKPPPDPILQPTTRQEAVGTTGSGVSEYVIDGIGSSVRTPADSCLRDLDLEPPSSNRYESHASRTSSAHDGGITESSELVSTPIAKSAATSRDIIVSVPATAGAPSNSHTEAPSPEPSLAQDSTPDGLTSKLAIACACNKEKAMASEQPGSQKPKVDARMSRGSRSGPGPGPGLGKEALMEDNDDLVGVRSSRQAYIGRGAGDYQRGRSRSPVQNPVAEEYEDNAYETLSAFVNASKVDTPFRIQRLYATLPALEYEDDNDYDTQNASAFVSKEGVPFEKLYPMMPESTDKGHYAMVITSDLARQVPVQVRPPRGRPRGRGRGRIEGDSGKRSAMALGDEYWQLERRRRELLRQRIGPGNERQRGPQMQDVEAADGFQAQQGDLLIRHRKWPGEPMIEFYDVDRHIIRPQDKLLRQSLQYDRRRDNMLCTASLWRASLVEVVDAQGHVGQEMRWDSMGSTQITFNNFVQLRGPRNRYIFGRRFEPTRYQI